MRAADGGGRPPAGAKTTLRGAARSALAAVLVAAGLCVLAALAAGIAALVGGRDVWGFLDVAKRAMFVVGALAMVLGALGLLMPNRSRAVGEKLRNRCGAQGGGLPWHVVSVVVGVLVEVVASAIDYATFGVG